MTHNPRWVGTVSQSGSIPTDAPGVVLFLGGGPLTILRTRCWSQITYASETVTPGFFPGNSFAPFVMRVAAYEDAAGPDAFWPAAFAETSLASDDLITQDMTWGTPMYVPPNVTVGRPEGLVQYASPAAGVADSAAQRRFSTNGFVDVQVAIVQMDAGGGTFDQQVNATIWIKCLVRYG